jgi:hypothetical protein
MVEYHVAPAVQREQTVDRGQIDPGLMVESSRIVLRNGG